MMETSTTQSSPFNHHRDYSFYIPIMPRAGYDQVEVLSEAHMNRTPKCNFTCPNSNLLNFKKSLQHGSRSLGEILKAPSVTIFHADTIDQPLLYLEFKDRMYFWMQYPIKDAKRDHRLGAFVVSVGKPNTCQNHHPNPRFLNHLSTLRSV